MKIILIHNPFEPFKLKSYLSLIIRAVTKKKSLKLQYNHCAAIVVLNGVPCVSDFQEHYKLRPLEEWENENTHRLYRIVELKSAKSDDWIKDQVLFASGRYKGYDWIKLINHLTIIKLNLVFFPENEDRFVCSEWTEFLLTGQKVNWAVPNDFTS